ncbi:cytochrome P450 [Paraburkholderia sp. 22B1P]|uniref:cytochrome P450 n=1 Tax=Paraburkholderia sp. 22B1P TaxID=3080498 RepID=UPI00308F0FCB|nr:cytochrome P450 [Paraburkholderia sp. 22B1P]
MRDEDPVHEDPKIGGWIVTRYEDVVAVLDDKRFSAERLPLTDEGYGSARAMREALSSQLLFLDPPDHTRLRKLFAKAFTPRRLDTFKPQIEALTHELLSSCMGRATDFIHEFAVPLPVTVIALVLGVPTDDRLKLRGWSAAFGSLISGRPIRGSEVAQALGGIAEFEDYFARLIQVRRAAPEDDLLSDLIAAEEAGDRLSEQELIANLILLLAAGHGTTTHFLGNGLLALSREPALWQAMVADPALVPAVVSELLRFDTPVQVTGRKAIQHVELAGRRIAEGARVRVVLGSANRDERHFANPDSLDIHREGTRTLSFGQGIHTCLGAVLARVEAQIAFNALVTRFPNLKVGSDLAERTSSVTFRGLQRLPVSLQ